MTVRRRVTAARRHSISLLQSTVGCAGQAEMSRLAASGRPPIAAPLVGGFRDPHLFVHAKTCSILSVSMSTADLPGPAKIVSVASHERQPCRSAHAYGTSKSSIIPPPRGHLQHQRARVGPARALLEGTRFFRNSWESVFRLHCWRGRPSCPCRRRPTTRQSVARSATRIATQRILRSARGRSLIARWCRSRWRIWRAARIEPAVPNEVRITLPHLREIGGRTWERAVQTTAA